MCATASAVLQYIQDNRLVERSAEMGSPVTDGVAFEEVIRELD